MSKNGVVIQDRVLQERDIVELFNSRDENAIKQTEKQYGKLIFRICQSILNNRQDSEECVNTVYFKLWDSIPPENPKSLKAYIIRLSRFVALDMFRTEHRKKRISSDMTESFDELSLFLHDSYSVEDSLIVKETTKLINDYIKSKQKEEQSVFIKRYYYFLPVSKIAEEDGLKKRQVNKILDEMKKELNIILTKGDQNDK